MLHMVMQTENCRPEFNCKSVLSMAANKAAHEHNSANQIKLGQCKVWSADGAELRLMIPKRNSDWKPGQLKIAMLFCFVNFCRAALLSAERSEQIPIWEETSEFFVARVQMPEAVSEWSWVGCICRVGEFNSWRIPPWSGRKGHENQAKGFLLYFVFSLLYPSHLGVGQQTQDINFHLRFLFIVGRVVFCDWLSPCASRMCQCYSVLKTKSFWNSVLLFLFSNFTELVEKFLYFEVLKYVVFLI